MTYIKYSLDFLRPITTAEAFEAVDWLADLPQQTWTQAGRSSDVILTSFCWNQQPQSRRRPCLLGIVRRLQLPWLARRLCRTRTTLHLGTACRRCCLMIVTWSYVSDHSEWGLQAHKAGWCFRYGTSTRRRRSTAAAAQKWTPICQRTVARG